MAVRGKMNHTDSQNALYVLLLAISAELAHAGVILTQKKNALGPFLVTLAISVFASCLLLWQKQGNIYLLGAVNIGIGLIGGPTLHALGKKLFRKYAERRAERFLGLDDDADTAPARRARKSTRSASSLPPGGPGEREEQGG